MVVRLVRVTGGQYRGLRLRTPPGSDTRPATGRVRESLFSSLGGTVAHTRVLDLYAGSGSLGIEALSRGSSWAVFVEKSRPALRALRSNLEAVGVGDQAQVVPRAVEQYVARRNPGQGFDIAFADPPWDISSERLAGILSKITDWMTPEAIVVITRRAGDTIPAPGGWGVADQRRHGDTQIIRYHQGVK